MHMSPRNPVIDIIPLTLEELPEVVELQRRHLKANMADLSDGFLVWETPLVDLVKYADFDSSFIASAVGIVVAYMINFDVKVSHQMTHPKQFLPILDKLQFDGQPITNYRICHGQILVDAAFCKRGIALDLYTAFLDSARGRYDIRLTGVHKQNRISYNFHHHKLGMKTIGVFGEKGERQLLVLDMR